MCVRGGVCERECEKCERVERVCVRGECVRERECVRVGERECV